MIHDKFHGSNHHTRKTSVYNQPDAGLDCIASHESPFHGDFVLSGVFVSTIDVEGDAAGVVVREGLAMKIYSENYSFDACGNVLCDNNISIDTLSLTNAVINIDKKYTSATNKVLFTNKDGSTCMRLWELNEVNISQHLPPKFILQPYLPPDFFNTLLHLSATLVCDTQSNYDVSYQWYHNKQPLLGANNKTLIIVNKGMYYVVASNKNGNTQSRTVFLTEPIQANNDTVNALPNTSTTFTVLDNDESILPARVVSFNSPRFGLLEFDAILNQFTYTPYKNYTGQDGFTYTLADEIFQTSTTSVTLCCVVDPCICVDETVTFNPQDINVFTFGRNNIKGTLEYDIFEFTQPKYGLLTIDKNTMTATYRPKILNNNYDQFTYTIRDAANNKSTGTVTLTV